MGEALTVQVSNLPKISSFQRIGAIGLARRFFVEIWAFFLFVGLCWRPLGQMNLPLTTDLASEQGRSHL